MRKSFRNHRFMDAFIHFSFSHARQQQTSLVGVDDTLKEALGFCLRSFFLQSQMNHVSGGWNTIRLEYLDINAPCTVSGLLLTGGRGFGKTSIIQAIAKNLQEDPRTLTCEYSSRDLLPLNLKQSDIHYVDVSRYSDKPVATMKTQFKYWAEKAAWHRPSVLILDNLDKLLSAEVEVRQYELFSFFSCYLVLRCAAQKFVPIKATNRAFCSCLFIVGSYLCSQLPRNSSVSDSGFKEWFACYRK